MKVTTFLTEGFETVEALAVVDVLRRAGVTVDLVSVTDKRQRAHRALLFWQSIHLTNTI